MKKIFTLLMTVFFCLSVFAQSGQTTRTITWGGTERQYIEYVPANVSNPAPVLFVFHGLGDDMANMFNATGFKQIADAHGWIVITPQALDASVMGFSIGSAWHSGASGSLGVMTVKAAFILENSISPPRTKTALYVKLPFSLMMPSPYFSWLIRVPTLKSFSSIQ